MKNGVQLQAHKGIELNYPENTMPAFNAAVKLGYERIELDLGYTKDGEIVTIHDSLINRTARLPDGGALPEKVNICDITYAQALEYDFGIGFSPEFAGTPLPLFSQVLSLAAQSGTLLKIDNKIRRFPKKMLDKVFNSIRSLI